MPEQTLPQLPATPPEVMNRAEPIFIDPGQHWHPFFHGFTGSPYEGAGFSVSFRQQRLCGLGPADTRTRHKAG
ncbi:MAG: hypothetical protein R3C26_15600 [Calditrichia bacterium]